MPFQILLTETLVIGFVVGVSSTIISITYFQSTHKMNIQIVNYSELIMCIDLVIPDDYVLLLANL